MLDLGFLPDVERILALTPAARQTMLFSATMPGAVVALARRYMNQPTHIRAMADDDRQNAHTVKAVEQFVYRAHAMDKVEMLARMLQAEGRGLTIVFSRTKRTAAKVADDLAERGFAAAAIHGDLGQGAREQALRAFRNGKVDILVATDVAARGIDVENVTHVINYQCPEDEKTYVHRIGRTARAGNTGIAVTFVDWDDIPRWGLINKALDLGIPEPAGDLLLLAAPLQRPRHPRGHQGPPPPREADPRGPGRRGARGPRRDRQVLAAAVRRGRWTAVATAAATVTAVAVAATVVVAAATVGSARAASSVDRPAECADAPRRTRNRSRRRTRGGSAAGETTS